MYVFFASITTITNDHQCLYIGAAAIQEKDEAVLKLTAMKNAMKMLAT